MAVSDLAQVFQKGWQHPESASGPGSTQRATQDLKLAIPRALAKIAPGRTPVVNDAGCGDLMWIRDCLPKPVDYAGYDVVEWATWPVLRDMGWKLEVADIIDDPMRPADITICRGVMIHLPNDMCMRLIENCRKSARWLLATTYTSGQYGAYRRYFMNNERLKKPSLGWSRLDLELAPFSLGKPALLIGEAHGGKYLGLWDLHAPVVEPGGHGLD